MIPIVAIGCAAAAAGGLGGGVAGHYNGKKVERNNLNQAHQNELEARDTQHQIALEVALNA